MYRNFRNTLAGTLVVGIASLSLAGAAQAATTDLATFDDFTAGSINGQFGWTVGEQYDTEVVDQAFRVSNAVTNGEFHFMPYSAPVDPAGENAVYNTLTNKFSFKSVTGKFQPGLAVSISPTGAGGSRMSYVRLEDAYDGTRVFFRDVTGEPDAMGRHEVAFTDKYLGTVDHGEHTIKFVTRFATGPYGNDTVRVSIDGVEKVCGGSWEDYYRFAEQHEPSSADRLMWRLNIAGGNDMLDGKGYLFDNVSSESSNTVANPCPPTGPKGEDGTDGEDGTVGANGKSAYQTWLDAGHVGTEAGFLTWLKGEAGEKGAAGENGKSAYQIWLGTHEGTEADFLTWLKGDTGEKGATGNTGATGPKGDTGSNGSNGSDGKNGANGTNGVNGKDGVTTVGGKLTGDTLRTIRVSVPKGAKFLGAKATLRNKRLPVKGRTIKVDLRKKPIGNYNVFITVKYAKGGKTFIVKSTRNLSVHTAR